MKIVFRLQRYIKKNESANKNGRYFCLGVIFRGWREGNTDMNESAKNAYYCKKYMVQVR